MTGTVELRSASLSASVRLQGAELCSLRSASGNELIWQAGPEWPRHAPWLFPIVGRLANDTLRVDGREYRLTQHGFARDMRFERIEQRADAASFRLRHSDETLARYPFEFELRIAYRLDGNQLDITCRVANPGRVVLPFSFGAHPAFNWPLPGNAGKAEHVITFAKDERAGVRRLRDGLMLPDRLPSPVEGRHLALDEQLFADDALIFDTLASSSVSYAGPKGPRIDLGWQGYRELGIWSKPSGAPFVCIEAWHGYASPAGFDGDIRDKQGIILLRPGDAHVFSMSIKVS